MVFLQAVDTHSILTDNVVIGIVGFIIVSLLSVMIGMIRYIWSERKKLLERELEKRDEYNNSLSTELEEVKILAQDQQVKATEINGVLKQLNITTTNLTGWLKKVDRKLDAVDREVREQKTDIGILKDRDKNK